MSDPLYGIDAELEDADPSLLTKENQMKRNIPLLEKTMTYILDHPEQHRQRTWVTSHQTPDCGTTACFAGWALLLDGMTYALLDGMTYAEVDDLVWSHHNRRPRILVEAASRLGLSTDEASMMFCATNTAEQLAHMVKDLVNGENILTKDYNETP